MYLVRCCGPVERRGLAVPMRSVVFAEVNRAPCRCQETVGGSCWEAKDARLCLCGRDGPRMMSWPCKVVGWIDVRVRCGR